MIIDEDNTFTLLKKKNILQEHLAESTVSHLKRGTLECAALVAVNHTM